MTALEKVHVVTHFILLFFVGAILADPCAAPP
jgi:hypothetical protein